MQKRKPVKLPMDIYDDAKSLAKKYGIPIIDVLTIKYNHNLQIKSIERKPKSKKRIFEFEPLEL